MSNTTRLQRTLISGTVGTTPVMILGANNQREFLKVHNPAASGGTYLAVTYDGQTTPVINATGTTIAPLWAETCDLNVPIGAVMLVGSNSGSPYTVEYA